MDPNFYFSFIHSFIHSLQMHRCSARTCSKNLSNVFWKFVVLTVTVNQKNFLKVVGKFNEIFIFGQDVLLFFPSFLRTLLPPGAVISRNSTSEFDCALQSVPNDTLHSRTDYQETWRASLGVDVAEEGSGGGGLGGGGGIRIHH